MMKYRKLVQKLSIAMLAGLLATPVPLTQAYADWRREMGVFRVGISTIDGEPLRGEKYDIFQTLLKNTLNMPVEIFEARNASALIDAMASSRIEYAILPAVGFATLDMFCSCVKPIAAPVSDNGANAVRSVLIVDQNSFTELSDIGGRKIAVGPQTSLTTSMIPYAFLTIDDASFSDSGVQIVETASQAEAVSMFTKGEIDGFFAWEFAMLGSDKEYGNRFFLDVAQNTGFRPAILWRSEPVRFGPHVVRNNLPKEAIDALTSALLSMYEEAPLIYDTIAPELAGGLSAVTKSDYASAGHLVRALASRE